MKLTQPQIQQLYTFTEKHYVEWYDVQTELVDHLANGIEFHLANNPNTTFETGSIDDQGIHKLVMTQNGIL